MNLNGKLKVGDLVTLNHASDSYRKERGVGVVTNVNKKKYQAAKVEVHFPNFKGLRRKKTIKVFVRDLQILSESGGFSQTAP
tara:strand:+ start:171 stop:416 length:246 start_codon:yes stop_codon:yes gene_type:complete